MNNTFPAILLLALGLPGFSCAAQKQPVVYVSAAISPYEREAMASVMLLNTDGEHSPSCGGVAIKRSGLTVLATAAHCVRHKIDPFDPAPNAEREAKLGDTIMYSTKGWSPFVPRLNRKSTIVDLDEVHDRAILYPVQDEAPAPLDVAELCDRCTTQPVQVHAIAPVFGWAQHEGVITGRTYAGGSNWFYESSVSINFGWSGSPVINSDGRVVGITIACNSVEVLDGDHAVKTCLPDWSVFTSIQ